MNQDQITKDYQEAVLKLQDQITKNYQETVLNLQDQITKNYQEAVLELIEENHKRELPVYQIEDGYIIGLYPGNKKVKLEKAGFFDLDSIKRYL